MEYKLRKLLIVRVTKAQVVFWLSKLSFQSWGALDKLYSYKPETALTAPMSTGDAGSDATRLHELEERRPRKTSEFVMKGLSGGMYIPYRQLSTNHTVDKC